MIYTEQQLPSTNDITAHSEKNLAFDFQSHQRNTPSTTFNLRDYFPKQSDWHDVLPYFHTEPMLALQTFLNLQHAPVFPPQAEIFNAFSQTSFAETKVVILGQDPYHGFGQANGLAFSVHQHIKIPPSLRNIFKELTADLSINTPSSGDLTAWAKQGVLLLNSVLTVNEGEPNSHQKQGWEQFTDHVIDTIQTQKQQVVFILWGGYAHKKGALIDRTRHQVICTAHPSPLSANRGGFFGTKVFSKTNAYLIATGQTPIDWKLS